MLKSEYRTLFAQCKKYVKFSVICKEVNVSQPCFTRFMQGYDWYVSPEKLEAIYKKLQEVGMKIV